MLDVKRQEEFIQFKAFILVAEIGEKVGRRNVVLEEGNGKGLSNDSKVYEVKRTKIKGIREVTNKLMPFAFIGGFFSDWINTKTRVNC